MNWRNAYLPQLFAERPKIFAVIVFLLLSQAFFTYKQIDSLPFFNYGMYSAKAEVLKESNIFLLRIDDDSSDFDWQLLPQLSRDLLHNNIAFYYGLHSRGQQQEAGLRQTIQTRFASFLSPEQLQYCYQQLSNPTQADAAAMRAWLIRFLQPYRQEKIKNIRLSRLIVSPLPQGFRQLDSFPIF